MVENSNYDKLEYWVENSKGKTINAAFNNRQKLLLRLLFLITFAFVLLVMPSYVLGAKTKNILILNSYHKGFEWTDAQVSAAKQVLLEKFRDIELYVEYMDTKRIYTAEYIERLMQIFKLKYKKVKFDAIITTDDNALKFVVKYHEEIFAKAPVSFCGINDYQEAMFKGRNEFTGLVEVLDIKPTIDLALKLHPNTRKVVVVVDNTPTGIGQRRDVAAVARQYEKLGFEFLKGEDLSNEELFEKLQNLPRDCIVLLTVWLRDKNNDYLPTNEGGPLISSNATIPVYGIIDMYMGHGITGGKLLNSRTHGKTAAEIALRILDGERPSDIPVIIKSTNPYMFDYRQLDRWGVSLSALPEGSVVINKPFSIYDEYKRYIWSVGAIFVLLVVFVAFLTANIQHRKRVEAALRESEEKYRVFVEGTNVLITRVDSEGVLIYVNHVAEKIFGFSIDKCIGMYAFDFVHPDDKERTQKWFKDIVAIKKTNGTMENRQVSQNGEIRNMLWTSNFYYDSYGNLVSVNGIARDITKRKMAEKALRESEVKYREFIEKAVIGIYQVTKEGQFLVVNNKMAKMLGYASSKEFLTTVENATHLYVRPEERPNILREINDKGSVEGKEVEFEKKDGRSIWVKLSTRVSRNKGGIIVYEGLIEDITDRKTLEFQLQQSQKMESIGTLAGGIAHDFNNILGIILGNAELAIDDVPEWNPARLNLEEVRTASLRAKDVVRQLLSFARKTKLEKKPTNITSIIKESLKLLRSSIPTSIEIRQNIPKDLDTIMADPTQINQVLLNLCTNADHSMPDGGVIVVTLENIELSKDTTDKYPELNPGCYVNLNVSDTGHGISQEDIDRIFDPYFTTKEVGQGTGMGLAVVHGIVKGHNGIITIESEPGKGTTFSIFFPVVEKEAVVETEPDRKLSHGDERILFIDDEESIVKIGHQILERLGYRVEATTNPIEALALFRSQPDNFNLVVTDLTMPKMTGDKLVKEILDIRPDLPIILCTGFSEKIDEKKAKEIGAADYIEKPLDKRDFAFKVRTVLDAHSIRPDTST